MLENPFDTKSSKEIATALNMVHECRMIFGDKQARQLWVMLGLPNLPVDSYDVVIYENKVREFIIEACVVTGKATDDLSLSDAYAAFQAWCAANDQVIESRAKFKSGMVREAGRVYEFADQVRSYFFGDGARELFRGIALREEWVTDKMDQMN